MTKDMTRERIREMLSQNLAITQKDIADRIGISTRTVMRHVKAIRAEWQGEVE